MRYADAQGNNAYGVIVELALVNRVYLTKTIINVRRIGSAQKGIFVATKHPGMDKQSPEPSSSPQGSSGDLEKIRKRLADIEAQLSKLSPGGVLTFEDHCSPPAQLLDLRGLLLPGFQRIGRPPRRWI